MKPDELSLKPHVAFRATYETQYKPLHAGTWRCSRGANATSEPIKREVIGAGSDSYGGQRRKRMRENNRLREGGTALGLDRWGLPLDNPGAQQLVIVTRDARSPTYDIAQ